MGACPQSNNGKAAYYSYQHQMQIILWFIYNYEYYPTRWGVEASQPQKSLINISRDHIYAKSENEENGEISNLEATNSLYIQ